MPTYSYACKSCGQAFDIHQSFTDDALTVCPNCGGELRKKFGNVGVVFKGGGFYRTDSQSGGGSGHSKESAGSPPSPKGATSGDSTKGTESTPAPSGGAAKDGGSPSGSSAPGTASPGSATGSVTS